jgi:hypothetical protein
MGKRRMGKWVVDKNEVKVKWPRYRKSNSPFFVYEKVRILFNSRLCKGVIFQNS